MDFLPNIVVGITCTTVRRKKEHWKEQLKEINQLQIKEIALFPCTLNYNERKEMYHLLEKSTVKEIKLVHLRDEDFTEAELDYFSRRFNTKVFNCHADHFDQLYEKFPHFHHNIALEFRAENKIKNKLEPNKMGGFCVDLAHFNIALHKKYQEAEYTLKYLPHTPILANHLSGYSQKREMDLHFVTNVHQFDFLTGLPSEVFSRNICFELENSIPAQLRYKEYVARLLQQKFK